LDNLVVCLEGVLLIGGKEIEFRKNVD